MIFRRSLIILCSIIICFGKVSFSEGMCHSVLDSISGEAEIQRAGQTQWIKAERGILLYDNDVIRVMDKSRARIMWKDSSIMFVKQNSQVLINLYENASHDLITRHATVFFGAVFFIIKEVLPRGTTGRCNTKIFTPTAVLAIRGTSFEVSVEKQSGTTEVRVINGTVQVGNILKNQSVLTSAGYSTKIAMNAEPLQPKAVLTDDITALKKWVPEIIVDSEMKNQIAKASRNLADISAIQKTPGKENRLDNHPQKNKKTETADKTQYAADIVIFPLENKTAYEGEWDIESGHSSILQNELSQQKDSLRLLVAESRVENAVSAGDSLNARYVITGQILAFEVMQRALISVDAAEYSEICVSRVAVFLELIEVNSKKVLFSKEFQGEFSGNNIPENTFREIAKLPFDMKNEKFKSTILGKSVAEVIAGAVEDIARYVQ